MKKQTLFLALLLVFSPSLAQAQVDIHIDIGLPPIPRLVVVQPGIQVVEGFQEEVFYRNGWYWCRRPNGWYRARRPQARFEWVEVRRVPRSLVQVPAGHYRNWHRQPKGDKYRGDEHREHRKFKKDKRDKHRDEGRGGEHHRR